MLVQKSLSYMWLLFVTWNLTLLLVMFFKAWRFQERHSKLLAHFDKQILKPSQPETKNSDGIIILSISIDACCSKGICSSWFFLNVIYLLIVTVGFFRIPKGFLSEMSWFFLVGKKPSFNSFFDWWNYRCLIFAQLSI